MGLFSSSQSQPFSDRRRGPRHDDREVGGEAGSLDSDGARRCRLTAVPVDPGGRRRHTACSSQCAPAAAAVPQNERQIYMTQLKVRIHQRLVERLDIQNLRSMPPEVVRGRGPPPGPRAVPVRKGTDQQLRPGTADGRHHGRDLRPGPARGPAEGPGHQRHPRQPLRPDLRRAARPAGTERSALPRQPAPAADHRPHRRPGRPPHRRDQPDGGRPPHRRQPRQRHHPAAGPGRPGHEHPPLRLQADAAGRPDPPRRVPRGR